VARPVPPRRPARPAARAAGAVLARRPCWRAAPPPGATSPLAVDGVLRDLRATLLDGDPPADPSDAPARFVAFTAP